MPPELDYATMSTDILIKGNLKKAKNWNKRFFVLRDGCPAKLEYYENERKWKSSSSKPKRRISLEKPWNIGKKKDTKHEFLIVIFTEDEYFSMAADNADIQEQWVNALQRAVRPEPGTLLFKHMWHTTLDSKELEGCKSNIHGSLNGPHRVCLTHDQMVFVHANASGGGDRGKGDPIEIRITNIRGCGHKEGAFFIECGRASTIGSGVLWMDVNDEVMAANMHQTILKIMYALNQEEVNGYRGRSYSSGSNSGRTRPMRTHHHNPPPSQIGMGKMASASQSSDKRIRCDSLPATHVGGLNDSRLRTGSEGENTMRRPIRHSSMRCPAGSTSPGMRNRLWLTHNNRRGTGLCAHHQNSSAHSHATSLPSSCTGSSTTSSNEHLNTALGSSGDFSSSGYGTLSHLPSLTTLVSSDGTSTEEFVGGHSPTQSYMQMIGRNGSIGRIHRSNTVTTGRSTTPEFFQQATATPPIQENTDVELHYCTMCLAHIPYSHDYTCQMLNPSDLAPPPPEMEPPHNPNSNLTSSAASSHEYVNISIHCRTQSLDDGLSSGTAASSLSASPQQPTNFPPTTNSTQTKSSAAANSSSPQDAGSISSAAKTQSLASESFSSYDYSSMDTEGSSKYPHHKMTPSVQKPSSPHNSIFSKFVSFTSSSSSHPGVASSPSSDYTPMAPKTSAAPASAESKIPSKAQTFRLRDYVPMRSFPIKSLPQDIGSRRRSVPDTAFRNSGNSHSRSSPPYGYSPEKSYEVMNSTRNVCQDCSDRIMAQKPPVPDESAYCKMQPGSFNGNLKITSDSGSEQEKEAPENAKSSTSAGTLAPPITESSSVSTSNPSSSKASDDYLSMQPQNQDIKEMTSRKTEMVESNLSNMSSSPAESGIYFKETEINGYLPMGPITVAGMVGHASRKNLVGSILSVAENHNQAPAPVSQYPHQRRPNLSTNSPDRPSKSSHRSKRPLSLGFRHSSGNPARKSQSVKQGKKNFNDHSPITQIISPPSSAATSHPPLSPGGEYVNIDFSEAQKQSQSPYVVTVTEADGPSRSPKMQTRQAKQPESEYTEMSLSPISKCCVQTNI